MINDKDLNDARNAWGNGIILISKTYDEKGIEEATKIAKKALKNNSKLKDEAIKSGLISQKDYNKIVDPKKLIKPNF